MRQRRTRSFDLNFSGISVASPCTLSQITASSVDAADRVGAGPQVEVKEMATGDASVLAHVFANQHQHLPVSGSHIRARVLSLRQSIYKEGVLTRNGMQRLSVSPGCR